MGRRHRQREKLVAPTSDYTDAEGNVLVLRGSLTPATRQRYASILHGGHHQEDAWQRAVELLFEHLAASWTIAGVASTRQKELLARYRIASEAERRFVRGALREHIEANFPGVQAP